jgi:hypothetical protein
MPSCFTRDTLLLFAERPLHQREQEGIVNKRAGKEPSQHVPKLNACEGEPHQAAFP